MKVVNNIDLEGFGVKVNEALAMYLSTKSIELQNTIRTEAPWTDRTGQARQRLTASVSRTDKGFKVELSHGVDYGLWLELAHEQRFAILNPTIKKEAPKVVKGCRSLINKIKL